MKNQPLKLAPFLLGATLLFWGWQSQLLIAGVLMAVAAESPRWIKTRWDLSDRDFNRIWTFCTLLLLAVTVYAFSANEGPSHFGGFFQNPNLRTERSVGTTTAKTMAVAVRWLPMIFFLFVLAQDFSTRAAIPLQTISLILRWQWRKARRFGQPVPASRDVNISGIYFALCLVAASVHTAEDTSFFWGLSVLVAWALWPLRARSLAVWGAALGVVVALGYFGQGGLGRMRIYLESFNPQWLTGLSRHGVDPRQSQTAMGQVGRVKGSSKIVIRLKPKENSLPPSLLREASYRDFKVERNDKSPTWFAGTPKDASENILSDKKDTTFSLIPGKTNTAGVNIACYLDRPEGLLPLPEGAGRLENLYIYGMKKNAAGTVIVQGPGLVIFDAFYGPGETIDSPPDLKQDTAIHDAREARAMQRVIEEFHLVGATREKTLQNINGFFESNFSYTTWQDRPILQNTNETALTRFLLRARKGHCEYFATATVLLLRKMNIPARYAVGYAVHEASGKQYVVRQRDGHAWCLVWDDRKKTWEDFDTTPASWVAAEEQRASSLEFLSDAWSRIVFEISKLRWGQTHLRQYILWGITPILGFLLIQIISRGRRKRHNGEDGAGELPRWPGLDSEFYELERKLSGQGFIREAGEPLRNWLRRAAAARELARVAPPLEKLLGLHYRYRFDPKGLTASERQELRRNASECLTLLDQPKN